MITADYKITNVIKAYKSQLDTSLNISVSRDSTKQEHKFINFRVSISKKSRDMLRYDMSIKLRRLSSILKNKAASIYNK